MKIKILLSIAKKNISNETRERIAASRRGKKATDEARKNQSAAMIGRVVSLETRKKIADAQRGVARKPCPAELRELLSAGMKGKIWTPEQIAKQIEALHYFNDQMDILNSTLNSFKMGMNIYRLFKENVDFEAEEENIKHFIENLI